MVFGITTRYYHAPQAVDLLTQLTHQAEGDAKRPHLTGGLNGSEIAQVQAGLGQSTAHALRTPSAPPHAALQTLLNKALAL